MIGKECHSVQVKLLKEELGYDEAFNYNTETDATLGK